MRVFSILYTKVEAEPSSNGRFHLSSRVTLAHKNRGSHLLWILGFGLALITVFQCSIAWKILSRLRPSDLLGEVNELFPSGMWKKQGNTEQPSDRFAVGVKVLRFVEKEGFNALNMSDPEWERAMPRKCLFERSDRRSLLM